MTEAIAAQMDLPLSSGVYVDSVVAGGPASRAGLRAGDIILSANGQAITEQSQLIDMIGGCAIGDTIVVEVYRSGETLTCEIVLEDKNQMNFDEVDPTR